MLNQADIAAHLDLSQQAVSDLIGRKILPKQKGGPVRTLDDYRAAYIRHLREMAASRVGSDDTLDLVNERARLAKEMADGQAMKNAQRRGELIEIDAAVREFGESLAIIRTRLLAIPSGHAARLARISRPAEMNEALYKIIVEVLEQLSDPGKYATLAAAATRRREQGDDPASEGVEP